MVVYHRKIRSIFNSALSSSLVSTLVGVMWPTYCFLLNYWWRAIPVKLKCLQANMPSYPQLCSIKVVWPLFQHRQITVLFTKCEPYWIAQRIILRRLKYELIKGSKMTSEAHWECKQISLVTNENCSVRVHHLISIESINEFYATESFFATSKNYKG